MGLDTNYLQSSQWHAATFPLGIIKTQNPQQAGHVRLETQLTQFLTPHPSFSFKLRSIREIKEKKRWRERGVKRDGEFLI